MLTKVLLCEYTLIFGVQGFLFPDDSTRIVSTPAGDIMGRVSDVPINSTTSYKVEVFKGIPYAEAPTGSLRFKKPVPKSAFTTTYDATKTSFTCPQYKNSYMKYPVGEDCLRLNVYVPEHGSAPPSGSTSLPVMVWIHGGGFTEGSSYGYDASILSPFGDVIVVTLNYRLSQFGFLSTGDSVVPGNLGHWDQQLAIQWVHNNIGAFGGDTDRVTIFGESSGSVSVIYQTFYPGNKGLFQRAIAESGGITTPWGFKSQGRNLKDSRKFAIEAGCVQNSSAEYIQCLSGKPITELIDLVYRLPYDLIPLPTVDGEFLLDRPANLLSGNTHATAAIDMFQSVDLIMGFNSADGLLDISSWLNKINSTNRDNFTIPRQVYEERIVPSYMYYFYNASYIPDTAAMAAVHAYTDWSDPNNDLNRLHQLIDLATDLSFTITTVNTARLHINSTRQTYVYEFFARPLVPETSIPPFLDDQDNTANHYDEVSYVFGKTYRNQSETPALARYLKTTQATMTFWTNFAKSGNPNQPEDVTRYADITWESYKDHEKYLEVSVDMGQHSVKSRVRPGKANLWNMLIPALMKQESNCN